MWSKSGSQFLDCFRNLLSCACNEIAAVVQRARVFGQLSQPVNQNELLEVTLEIGASDVGLVDVVTSSPDSIVNEVVSRESDLLLLIDFVEKHS